jgi:thiol-disulfide isomerase/thioredoxin
MFAFSPFPYLYPMPAQRILTTFLLAILLHTPRLQAQNKTPDLVVTGEDGHSRNVRQMQGKVVLVNFWSLTCVPCKQEMPTLNALALHFSHDTNFVVLPVDLDRKLAEDRTYFAEKNYVLRLYKPAGVVPQQLFRGVLPTTVIIDKRGDIAWFREEEGRYDTPEFMARIDSLLAR